MWQWRRGPGRTRTNSPSRTLIRAALDVDYSAKRSSSNEPSNGESKLKALRELKNQIIGNRTKKLFYIKLGAVPYVVSILSSAVSAFPYGHGDVNSLLVQSIAAIGSFACGVDASVKAVLDARAFPHLLSLISHPNEKFICML